MHIELRLAPEGARRWHLELARRLTSRPGTSVTIDAGDATRSTDDGRREPHDPLLRLERVLHGVRPVLAAPCGPDELRPWTGTGARVPDLVLDLGGDPAPADGWRLAFDGRPGTAGAVAVLAQGRFPVVTITAAGDTISSGRPGSEQPGVLTAALEDVLAGSLLLVEQAVAGNRMRLQPPGRTPLPDAAAAVPTPTAQRPSGMRLARTVAGAGVRRAYRAAYRAPHWRVGWRFVEDGAPGALELGGHPDQGWSTLPDDGYHFYADPFPAVAEGRHWLFVEDYDHRVGCGVISVVEMTPDGPVGTPRTVLRHETHLSYPYVLEEDGAWWMIPETSGAGTVELYRATDFPRGWRRERVLLRGLTASDVSVVRHDDRWWMFATVRHGGSWSDALHVWWAEHLAGPWHPHRRNPVLLDIAGARPAGRPVHHDGRLLRPVQDGSRGYGSGLAVAEVVRLDEDAYEQRVVGRLDPGPAWPGTRLHTLNRAGRLECIDGSARSPRFRLR